MSLLQFDSSNDINKCNVIIYYRGIYIYIHKTVTQCISAISTTDYDPDPGKVVTDDE